jgi:hypothetical protein
MRNAEEGHAFELHARFGFAAAKPHIPPRRTGSEWRTNSVGRLFRVPLTDVRPVAWTGKLPPPPYPVRAGGQRRGSKEKGEGIAKHDGTPRPERP